MFGFWTFFFLYLSIMTSFSNRCFFATSLLRIHSKAETFKFFLSKHFPFFLILSLASPPPGSSLETIRNGYSLYPSSLLYPLEYLCSNIHMRLEISPLVTPIFCITLAGIPYARGISHRSHPGWCADGQIPGKQTCP